MGGPGRARPGRARPGRARPGRARPGRTAPEDGPHAAPRRLTRREWMQRLGWMVALWAGGVVALAAVAYVIRVIMHALGMR